MNRREALFMLKYEQLKDFVHKYHRRPQRADNARLYNFYNDVKAMYKKGRLSPEKYELLFPYVEFRNELELHWHEMYDKAKEYYQSHNNLKVIGNSDLGRWLEAQRHMFHRCPQKYDERRRAALDEIGMRWNIYDEHFVEKLAEAEKAIALYGRIPTKEDDSIRNWINDIKKDYKAGKIPSDRLPEIRRVLGSFLDKKLRQTGRDVYLLEIDGIKECHSSIDSILNKYDESTLGVSRRMLYKHDFVKTFVNKRIMIEYFKLQTIKTI